MVLAGIDVGTTGSKISVYDSNGTRLFDTYRDYPASRTASAHEVVPDAIFDAVKQLLQAAGAAVGPIDGIGVSSFGESFALLDERDETLTNAIFYTDPRGDAECHAFAEAFGVERLARITGAMPHNMFSLAKLLWIRDHQPELLRRAKRLLLMEDYVIYRLTGVAQIDYALAARTLAFDIRTLSFSDEILSAAGIERSLFSKPVPSGTKAGPIQPALAQALGLSGALMVVNGCHDQVAAAVGAGVFDDTVVVDGAGTTECITPVFRMPSDTKPLHDGGFSIVPFLDTGLYACYAFTFTGGALVKWFTETLAGNARAEAEREGVSLYTVLERGMTDAPTGLFVQPHFAGSGTPTMDTGSRGAITGLSISTSLSDLYKAVLEGVAYEMRLNTNALAKAGIPVPRLHATGGGAKSAAWLQIKADMLGCEIVSLGDSEAGTIGGIMLTGVAVGAYPTLAAAGDTFIHKLGVYKPDPAKHEAYTRLFAQYETLYRAVRPFGA